MKRKIKSVYFQMGVGLTAVMTALIVLGFFWTPYEPDAMQGSIKLQGPSLLHLFGTDQFGRDIFSRVLSGAGNTLIIALGTILIGGIDRCDFRSSDRIFWWLARRNTYESQRRTGSISKCTVGVGSHKYFWYRKI